MPGALSHNYGHSLYLNELRSHACQNIDTVKECVEPYINQASETAAKKLGSFIALLKILLKGDTDEWPLVDISREKISLVYLIVS